MSDLSTYSVIVLLAAAILPPLAAGVMALAIRKHTKAMKRTNAHVDMRLRQMDQVEAAIQELVASPERIKAAQKAIRDTVTRIQEMP